MGMTRGGNLKPRAALLVVGLLATLLVLALGACGGGGEAGGQEEAGARPLPLYENALRPGEYHSVEFKPPLTFEVSKPWSITTEQLPDWIELGYERETGVISVANVEEVFKPGTTNVVDAPEDLVGWLQQHPYLKTSKPEPVTVGGVKGAEFEVLVDHLPKDPDGYCGTDCLDISYQSSGDQIGIFREAYKRRVIVLEDVKGETVVIWFAGPPETFDKFASKAQKVVDSVRWEGP